MVTLTTKKQRDTQRAPAPDFTVTNHGSVWSIQAVSPEAIAFAQDCFDVEPWQGLPENFTTDWRAASALAERLMSEGWSVQ